MGTSLGYLRLSFVYQPETRSLVSSFLTDAAERILSMQKVSALVAEEYNRFLTWLGLPAHLHRDYPAARVAGLLVETAREGGKASEKLAREKAREAKKNQGDEFAKEDTEGERRVWDNCSCEQGLEKEQPSVKEPHQERLDRES